MREECFRGAKFLLRLLESIGCEAKLAQVGWAGPAVPAISMLACCAWQRASTATHVCLPVGAVLEARRLPAAVWAGTGRGHVAPAAAGMVAAPLRT